MDIRLAGEMDGVEVAEHIRRECDVPVIFLTATRTVRPWTGPNAANRSGIS